MIPADLLHPVLLFAAYPLWLLVLAKAVWMAPWQRLRGSHEQHVLLGAIVSLLLLWQLQAGIKPGLGFHFLGITLIALMFGRPLAFLVASVVVVGTMMADGLDFTALAVNALVFAVWPVMLSISVCKLVHTRLPRNVFLYIFGCGFFGAAIAVAGVIALQVTLLLLSGTYGFDEIANNFLPFVPLLLLPEGTVNGMLVAVMVGFRPDWLWTFDEKSYFGPPR